MASAASSLHYRDRIARPVVPVDESHNLTHRITSNLELREVLRPTACDIRELTRVVRVGGNDGAVARLNINRTRLLSRTKKFGIHAKKYA